MALVSLELCPHARSWNLWSQPWEGQCSNTPLHRWGNRGSGLYMVHNSRPSLCDASGASALRPAGGVAPPRTPGPPC